MAEDTHLTADVFGVSRDLPTTYVVRDAVDDKLLDNLTRDKHVIVYGSSKQGKTCLRKHCLQDDDYILVQIPGVGSSSPWHPCRVQGFLRGRGVPSA